MFSANIYQTRRKRLKKQVKTGLALFLGNEESPINYAANTYAFRQDSSFLYFFGLDYPGLAGIVDVDEDRDILFGNDVSLEDVIWMGAQPLLKDRAFGVGVNEVCSLSRLEEVLKDVIRQERKVLFLPPYRTETTLKISNLLGFHPSQVKDHVSKELIAAVVAQRSVKTKEEIGEMEKAQAVTAEMYAAALAMTRAGLYEREVAGKMEEVAFSAGCALAFPTIFTINGQILHNHDYGNRLQKGRLIVADSGAESQLHYAADITRTFPVDGKFTEKQKDIYRIVLNAQETAIRAIKPGVKYRSVHIKAAKAIFSGLKDLGLTRGNVEEGVKDGTHALFFPHGLGHMIGLDVHDLENLGENYVGYDEKTRRSEQFGLAYLRMARELEPGFVLSVEPGIYFIPALIDKWRAEKKHRRFINYEKVEGFRDFGGIRIEDDVLVTEKGCRVLGRGIPKTIEELEGVKGKVP